jgi:hypothetical protein
MKDNISWKLILTIWLQIYEVNIFMRLPFVVASFPSGAEIKRMERDNTIFL